MSRILQFVIDIFTFADPVASAAFYAALIILPAISKVLGKNDPQKFSKIVGMAVTGVAVALSIIGVVFLIMIGGSSQEVDLSEGEIDGKEIVEVEIRGKESLWRLHEGQLYEPKNVDAEAAAEYMERDPSKFKMIEDKFYALAEDPGTSNLTRVIFADGSSKKIVDGEHWDQGTVGWAIQLSMIIIYVCFGLMLGFGLSKIVEAPKRATGALIMIGGLLLVFVLGYAIEGSMFGELSTDFLAKMEKNGETITPQDQADAGAGLVTTFILIGLALVSWIGGEVYKMVK